MVKKLSPLETDELTKTLQNIEAKTGASVATVITPVSGTYLSYIFLDTFLIAGLINGALYLSKLVVNIEYFALIQFAFLLAVVIPHYRHWLVALLPRAIRHHHAARSAVMAYHHILNQQPEGKDVVLLYVSVAERYVHVFHSRSLNKKVDPTLWRDIIAQFILIMPRLGMGEAAIQAVKNIGNALGA